MDKEKQTRILLMRVAIVALVLWIAFTAAIFVMVLQRYLELGNMAEMIR